MNQVPATCPLCQQDHIGYYSADTRSYWQCANCQLVFVESAEHLTEVDEKTRYDHHNNNPDDPRYREFLNRLIGPLSDRLQPNSEGLDFGCGPGPTVSVMLEELGHKVACFDKYYANTPRLLNKSYDFITSTEVLEHLREPRVELLRLIDMLKPAGFLGIMTMLQPPSEQFASWHYKKDPTHICFYAESTFEWIAAEWDLSLEIIESDVVILQSGN